ncbi:MAG: GYD domain-containing protein [Terracidiphilus sp.]|jgi:uncharacterized protein with GYD domain
MATYLVQTSYTQQALAAMVKKAQNRTEPIRKAVEKLGGSLVGLWLSFGKHDVVCMMEMPDNISAAAMAIAVAAGGAVQNTHTTPLLSVEDGIVALKKAAGSGYKAVTRK